jgi:hypothetical protein
MVLHAFAHGKEGFYVETFFYLAEHLLSFFDLIPWIIFPHHASFKLFDKVIILASKFNICRQKGRISIDRIEFISLVCEKLHQGIVFFVVDFHVNNTVAEFTDLNGLL